MTLSKSSLNTSGSQQGGHETVGTAGGPTATEISICPRPSRSAEADPPARWPIAREELITAAASATTTIAPIANGVACFIEPFISLCHCRVESKIRRIRRVTYCESHLTRIRLQFVIYFLPFRGKTAQKDGEMPNPTLAQRNAPRAPKLLARQGLSHARIVPNHSAFGKRNGARECAE
jgi:hypothetical protein